MSETRLTALAIAVAAIAWLPIAAAAQDKPNIVVIWGDDIGQSNISAYSCGGGSGLSRSPR